MYENIKWFPTIRKAYNKMDQKYPKMSLTWEDLTYLLFSDHQSNTKKSCAKYHDNIFSFSRHGAKYPKWAQKYLKLAQSRRQPSYIFFLFFTNQSNSKNICVEFHEKVLNSWKEIEKHTQNGLQEFSKSPVSKVQHPIKFLLVWR